MKLILFYVFIALLFFSCKSDTDKDVFDSLYGEWHVYNATRNNKPTKTLNRGLFLFTSDSTFSTNIFGGSMTQHKYDIEDNVIVTNDLPKLNLAIQRVHPDTLRLSGKIRHFYMQFYLAKDHGSTH